MDKLALALILPIFALAVQVEVSADSFFANEKRGENVLRGNVVVKRDKDILHASKLLVLTNKNKKASKYIASGNARFEITLKDSFYKGKGDEIIYEVSKDTYEINGNAFLEEPAANNKVTGKKIIIDRKQEKYSVFSDEQKPAKFVFELEEK